MTKTEGSLVELIERLCGKIADADFPAVKNACKDGVIPGEDFIGISSAKEWFQFLCNKKLLLPDDPSFIEHVFELCRRPDLLAEVMKYRLDNNLGLEDEAEIGRKLVRVRSAKKYVEISQETPGAPKLKLSDPPKTRQKSASIKKLSWDL